jgi:two-component system sensor histidine kinase PhoQ
MISLRMRVSLSAALVLAIFIALTALALERAFEENARAAMQERLYAQLYLVMAATEVDNQGQLQMPDKLGEPRLNLPGSGLYALITTAGGTVQWHSPSAVGLALADALPQSGNSDQISILPIDGTEFFVTRLSIEWEAGESRYPLVFSVIENLTPYEVQLNSYRRSLWIWLGAMALLLLIAQGAVLAWGLRPLHTVAREIKAIESGSQEELKEDYPQELRRLTDNINALIIREHAQQGRYKNALSDLAHSLKTPLTILRGLEPSDQQAGELARTLEEQVARMDSIVQYQLQRAATAGRSALAPPLPVKPVAERLLATLAKVYRDKAITVSATIAEPATFRGDEGDLMELLGNLLDNAFKWCHGTVALSASCEGNRVVIRVEDDGPGIDQDKAEQVLQRGVRMDETTPGHGIGLPMVRDIVEVYGGEMTINRSDMNGSAVEVKLPGC